MATVKDIHQPSLCLFPVNHNTTGWVPVGLPMILVVPHKRDNRGVGLPNSEVWNTRIYIEDVPQIARVAGHQHIGERFPDKELYAINISQFELLDRQINISLLTYTHNNETIDYADATRNDTFQYTTASGITDTLTYLPDADYYDLSDITLDIEQLPSDLYNLVYQTHYYLRLVSAENTLELQCIDTNTEATADIKFMLNHPGDILDEMYHQTPPPLLTDANKSQDTTVKLYRPFADAIQDVMDEQKFIPRINWIYNSPPEAIPYLSALLGWDLPYFPESLDKLRRAVLRNTTALQQLKGSRQAIIELFRLFGFEILISNLWWSHDGKRYIRPGQSQPAPYDIDEITIEEVCQIDILLNAYNTNGYGELTIPLLFPPQQVAGLDSFTALKDGGNITIDAYLVASGSEADITLSQLATTITNDPSEYGIESGFIIDSQGFINPTGIHAALSGQQVIGYSQVLITGKDGQATLQTTAGAEPPLTKEGCSFSRPNNKLSITFSGYQDFTDRKLYAFATYKRQDLMVPDQLIGLQSNRFDIQIISRATEDLIDPVTLEFSLEFLDKVKAFHSLLNVVDYRIEMNEVYAVTDICLGGDIQQRYDTDMGRQQVPPAIIPDIPSENTCGRLDPTSLGYKPSDLLYRKRVLSGLELEFQAWKIYDEILASVGGTRLSPMLPADRDACLYTPFGQDRIIGTRVESVTTEYGPSPVATQGGDKLSPNNTIINGEFTPTGPTVSSQSDTSSYGLFDRTYTETRTPQCELDGNDYCYKGRVNDELLHRRELTLDEVINSKACNLSLGKGVYWAYPSPSIRTRAGVQIPFGGVTVKSSTPLSAFSGGTIANNIYGVNSGIQSEYLATPYDSPLSVKNNSRLGKLYRAYGVPNGESLHFWNRNTSPSFGNHQNLALERPSLGIEKGTLHLPGCRFPMMNALQSDFAHPTWDAKPWDTTACGPVGCQSDPTFLNAVLTVGDDGDEYLSYDEVAYINLGNGLVPDISNLSDNALATDVDFGVNDVIHSVYMESAEGHEAITLDQVCPYDTSVGDGTIITNAPIFTSNMQCGTDTSLFYDFADGYACERGLVGVSEDISRSGLYTDVFEALGVPSAAGTGNTVNFLLGSGILVDDGIRLDCGCTVLTCSETAETNLLCSASLFVDSDGEYDWEPDHITVIPILVADESLDAKSILLDGSIPSLLETV